MSDLGWSLKLVNEEKQDVGEHCFIPDVGKPHWLIDNSVNAGADPDGIVLSTGHWILRCSPNYRYSDVRYMQVRENGVPYAHVPLSASAFDQIVTGKYTSHASGYFDQELVQLTVKVKDLIGFNHSPAYNANGGCADCGMPRGEGHWTYCKRHEVY